MDLANALVVDDDLPLRRLAARVLQRAGFLVTDAGDPVHALRLVHDGLRVDLLLSDVRMPGMSGTEPTPRRPPPPGGRDGDPTPSVP